MIYANLDRNFSTFIRMRDRIPGTNLVKCISCGKVLDWKTAHCGHFINRKHMSTRWDEKNNNSQCASCNSWDEGNIPGYTVGLKKKYNDPQIVEKLLIQKNKTVKFSQVEINLMNKHYLNEIKKMK